jgi:hypothetical protein
LASMLKRRRPFFRIAKHRSWAVALLNLICDLRRVAPPFYPTRRRAFAIHGSASPLRRSRVPHTAEPAHLASSLMRRLLLLKSSTDYSAESKCMIRPIALSRARRSYLPNSPAQPKHDSRPRALGCCFLTELCFQAALEYLGIGFLVFCRGGVQEHGSKRSQFSANGFSRPRTRLPGSAESKRRNWAVRFRVQRFSPESSTVPLSAAVKRHLPS